MATHSLKIKPEYIEAVRGGRKTFELRRDDRGCLEYGLADGFCILSISPAEAGR